MFSKWVRILHSITHSNSFSIRLVTLMGLYIFDGGDKESGAG